MRLIDADELPTYDDFQRQFDHIRTLRPHTHRSFANALLLVKHTINNAPTVDAVPLKHGQWLPAYNPDGTVINGVKRCSQCGEIFNEYPKYDYCGCCGSNNKGDKNE